MGYGKFKYKSLHLNMQVSYLDMKSLETAKKKKKICSGTIIKVPSISYLLLLAKCKVQTNQVS